jgi:hypothetical protein
MWKLFQRSTACPVDDEMRQWVDGRFRWLRDRLGRDTPRDVRVVLPTPEFFPDPYDGSKEAALTIFDRVCGYMKVGPRQFRVFVYDAGRAPDIGIGHRSESSSAGVYICDGGSDATGARVPAIGIEASQLADPMSLVATLAHEIGHEILLGQGHVAHDTSDHEPLTDLLTVFMGMGIFSSNSTISDRAWTSGGMAGWQTNRLGYLDQRTFGYALARFAWARGETSPAWARHVRLDVRSPLRQGLRFLAATSVAEGTSEPLTG